MLGGKGGEQFVTCCRCIPPFANSRTAFTYGTHIYGKPVGIIVVKGMGAAVIVIRVSSVCAFSLGLRVSIAGRRPVDSDEPWTDCRSSSVQLAPVATVRLTLGRSVGGGRETMPDGSHCLQAVGRVAN